MDGEDVTSISCPFCTKTGIAMVITGLVFVLMSGTTTISWLALIGLIFLIGAYIVPNLVSRQNCKGENCTNRSHNHVEEES